MVLFASLFAAFFKHNPNSSWWANLLVDTIPIAAFALGLALLELYRRARSGRLDAPSETAKAEKGAKADEHIQGGAVAFASQAEWHVIHGGKEVGPFSLGDLVGRAVAGEIASDDLVKGVGGIWNKARDVDFLRQVFVKAAADEASNKRVRFEGTWLTKKALAIGGIVFLALAVSFVFLRKDNTPEYRPIDESGAWNIPGRHAMVYEIRASRISKAHVELTRTTPGWLVVFLVDAANHRKLQAAGIGLFAPGLGPFERRPAPGSIDEALSGRGIPRGMTLLDASAPDARPDLPPGIPRPMTAADARAPEPVPDLPPGIVTLFKSEKNNTVTASDISMTAGSYFLYTENTDFDRITVKFRVSEFR